MRKTTLCIFPTLLLWGLTSVSEGDLYRWEDDKGNVHYSDTIPPDRVRSGHTELSDGGVRIKTVPPARSPEEVQKEEELKRMRAQQEELVEKQRSADRDFLNTFRSEDDIVMARDGKIAHVDVMIDVTKAEILRQQHRLGKLLAEAADLERAGQPAPQQLTDNITQSEQTIRDAYAGIVDREEQKRTIRDSFDKDLVRFQRLKNLPANATPVKSQDMRPILHNIVTCRDLEECNRLWEKATDYARRHSTTQVQASSPVVFITAPAINDRDVSLILARINDKNGPGASLFLDLQCARSARGKEICEGQGAQGIIEGFRPAITGEDAPPP